jgi:hypothetical protein
MSHGSVACHLVADDGSGPDVRDLPEQAQPSRLVERRR